MKGSNLKIKVCQKSGNWGGGDGRVLGSDSDDLQRSVHVDEDVRVNESQLRRKMIFQVGCDHRCDQKTQIMNILVISKAYVTVK